MNIRMRVSEQGWREGLRELWQGLRRWPWLDTFRVFVQRYREERLGLTAGSLTFTTLISLVPLLTVALALFTAFPMFSAFQGALEKYFLKSLVPDTIARPVLGSLTQFAAKANRLGAVGLVVLAVTALMLMLTIDRTLNQIWRVQRPRPIAQRVLVYWAALTLGPLLLGGSLTLTSYLITTGKDLVNNMPRSLVVLLSSVDLVVLWAAMAALFHYVPNTDVRWRHALVGAGFVAVAFHLAKQALAWYVKQVPTYSTLYGAFATVPIFLIWIYVGWSIVLLGAILAANAPALAGGVSVRRAAPGMQLELALDILRELESARTSGGTGLTLLGLSESLCVDPLQLEPVIDQLIDLDWVGRLEEDGAQRLVLLCDPAATRAEPLIHALLLPRSDSLGALWSGAKWDQLTLRAVMVK
ncbi:YihY family inner membrane protein [Roseateles sp. SL47]|uniref:YihY family inner membrane protein n=1 Tax=Roseateles sp. SL47 TaxID=2995138 RepID=UPI00226DCA11|nr:YihY family inner membrane protein [Roseateles sp. SL47]WAC71094.1 YihY family inner membrane protein [Roseateles sp. SL47]